MSPTFRSHSRVRLVTGSATASLALLLPLSAGAGPATASPPPSPTTSASASTKPGHSEVDPPKVRGWSWMVADADTGAVLGGRAWHFQLPPASTLKTLTALTLLPRLDLDSQYQVTDADSNAEGSHVGLTPGSHYTVKDLMHGMLMPSGNDAAAALASAYGGRERAAAAMNAEAARIGAKDTRAVNTSGLDEPEQLTTAYDLTVIFRAALQNNDFRDIVALHDTEFPAEEPVNPGDERKTKKIWTENRLVLNYYPGAIGGKTGFTSQAGRTYVGAVKRGGRTLIVTLMRIAESTERTAMRILTWGFDNYDKLVPVDKLATAEPMAGSPIREAAMKPGEAPREILGIDGSTTGSSWGSTAVKLLLFFMFVVSAGVVLLRIRARRLAEHRRAELAAARQQFGGPYSGDQYVDVRQSDSSRSP